MLGNTLGQALRYEPNIHPAQPAAGMRPCSGRWGAWDGGSHHFSHKTGANNSNMQRCANPLDPSAEIQKNLRGLCGVWSCILAGEGREEAGAWHSKQMCCSSVGEWRGQALGSLASLGDHELFHATCALYYCLRKVVTFPVFASAWFPKLHVSSTAKTLSRYIYHEG